MLNLETGKIYHITDFLGCHHSFKVESKEVNGPKSHVYHGTWPNPNSIHNFYRYFHDCGIANQGFTIAAAYHYIKTCEEVASYGRVDSNGDFVLHFKKEESNGNRQTKR